jgi:hypothetical protein
MLEDVAEWVLIRTRHAPRGGAMKMGRKPKRTDHQKREAIKRRDHGEETFAEIGRSYNVSGWTIARLTSQGFQISAAAP